MHHVHSHHCFDYYADAVLMWTRDKVDEIAARRREASERLTELPDFSARARFRPETPREMAFADALVRLTPVVPWARPGRGYEPPKLHGNTLTGTDLDAYRAALAEFARVLTPMFTSRAA